MVHLHLPQCFLHLKTPKYSYYIGFYNLICYLVKIKSPLLPVLHHSSLKCWSMSLAFMEESHITGRNLLFASMLFRLSASDAVWISEAGLQSLTGCVCKHNLPEMLCNRLQITEVTHLHIGLSKFPALALMGCCNKTDKNVLGWQCDSFPP